MRKTKDKLKVDNDYEEIVKKFQDERIHIRHQLLRSRSSMELFKAKLRIDEFFKQINETIKIIRITCSDLFEKKEKNKEALKFLLDIKEDALYEFGVFLSK
ncbi:hypothetical protein ABE068_25055 [Bacillus glycinifermentans]|uniref:Uncharacterized protein n=1 Tax=Bacillus glycinifermentans TaxID=1664069 RepID=A0A0T6BM44_9BACI|nr:hypothetical protein [Bacillus glycinifermentans]KRT92725.1 hypothetical protein AB447_222355 [Bacillus glycinifermentans]MEC0483401.1 hypothetical protein [Bacillus glycinifermentans]